MENDESSCHCFLAGDIEGLLLLSVKTLYSRARTGFNDVISYEQ